MPDFADYCRQLETYLCQKNGGHLIRIVGPAFQRVCGWAELGVPLTVAYKGIDRYCERQQAKTTVRRRPVRIEFCEDEILAQFDDWRRAVGVTLTPAADSSAPSRKPTLTAHVERVVARLVGRRAPKSPSVERHIEGLLVELDRVSAAARHARGDIRAKIVERLADLDRDLIRVAREGIDNESAALARREAEAEISPFAARMTPDVRAQALEAAYERLVRESLELPLIRYE
jgi:vacuolar-type H+-ATPase subunit H